MRPKKTKLKIPLLSELIEMAMLFLGVINAILFTVSSIFEIFLKKNLYVMSIYILTFFLFAGHLIIRHRYPKKFVKTYRKWKPEVERFNSLISDYFIKASITLASSVSIMLIIFPTKYPFYTKSFQNLSLEMSLGYFVTTLIMFGVVGLPFIFKKILRLVLGEKADLKKIINKFLIFELLIILILTFVFVVQDLFYNKTYLGVFLEQILTNDKVKSLYAYLLGVPLFFWLRYLYIGVDWLQPKI